MKREAFSDSSRWWIYRNTITRRWDVSSPAGGDCAPLQIHDFPTGAQALAAYAAGAS
ncbi:MAG: hypothetical protein PGN37_20360 [Mycobacterium kyogaense]|uniref:hypothetical protein n=1 Tax=Mycobacterium kyogaense TaxID=2212479 RepID=UPI002FF99D31